MEELHEDDALRAVRAADELRDARRRAAASTRGEVFIGAGRARRRVRDRRGRGRRRAAGRARRAGRGAARRGRAPARRGGRQRGAAPATHGGWRHSASPPRSRSGRLRPRSSGASASSRSCGTRWPPRGASGRCGCSPSSGRRASASRGSPTRRARSWTRRRQRALPQLRRGLAYRPLAEIVGQLGDVASLLAGDEQADVIPAACSPPPASPTSRPRRRRRPGRCAGCSRPPRRERPLVVVIDDAHWAEPALLDLVDYLVAFSSGAAILLVCLGRPELLERRPSWAAPQRSAAVLGLDALDEIDALALVARLGAQGLAARRMVERADGNPLFLEQLVAIGAGGRAAADRRGRAGRAARPARRGGAHAARARRRRGQELPPRRARGARRRAT